MTSEFDAFAERNKITSDSQKARFIGCGNATISRIRAGQQSPGPEFIAMVYSAVRALDHRVDPGRFFDFYGSNP